MFLMTESIVKRPVFGELAGMQYFAGEPARVQPSRSFRRSFLPSTPDFYLRLCQHLAPDHRSYGLSQEALFLGDRVSAREQPQQRGNYRGP